jgi:hypothetical protein
MTKMRRTLRRGTMAALMLGVTSVGLAGVGTSVAGAAWAHGTYAVSYSWNGYGGGAFDLTLNNEHRFTTNFPTEHGTYTYKKGKLTFEYTYLPCGALYTGTGTPFTGFSGTSLVTANEVGCLPQGTTGTWSTGVKGAAVRSSAVSGSGAL